MSIEQAFNYRKVSERVGTAGLLSEEQLRALKREGYESLINLLPDDSEYAIPGERQLVEDQGIDYRHIPVDFAAPTQSDYLEFVTVMKELEGKKLMIHCAANYRVSAFYALYAYQHQGWSITQANGFIASLWNPAEHEPWESFIASLAP
jgi:protein tyrosine phosphatase (PTP) superfamily phosphohydrolase (DUF442 family)